MSVPKSRFGGVVFADSQMDVAIVAPPLVAKLAAATARPASCVARIGPETAAGHALMKRLSVASSLLSLTLTFACARRRRSPAWR